MKQSDTFKVSLLLADVLIFFICLGGFYLIFIKADLPFKTTYSNSKIIIAEYLQEYPNIKTGDAIISIDSYRFSKWEEIELYLDDKKPGETVNLQVESEHKIKSLNVVLTKYYNAFELIIISLVSFIFITMGVFVRIKARENNSALLFHWASAGLGMVIVLTAGYYDSQQFSYGHINRIIWLFVYSLTPVLFIHFASSFTKKKIKSINYFLWFFYICALINALYLSYLFLDATLNSNINNLKNYVFFFDSFFRLFLITCVIIAISTCIYAYRGSTDLEERKRMQWLLLGFFIGPFSFIIFWVIPILLTGYSLVPESLILIFLTAIPFTFSIAIIKYHLMDINLIIRRSVLYTLVLGIIISTYVGVSSLITLFVNNYNPTFPSVMTAFAVVVLLQPLKNKIQMIIDKRFFRVEYDFREEQNKFLDAMKEVYDVQTLAELIVFRVDKLIPIEKIGFFELNNQNGRIKIIAENGWEILRNRSIRFEFENLNTDLSVPIVVDNKVEPGLRVESADIKVFRRWGMVLVFSIKSPGGLIHGFLVLGTKKSGTRFFKDDIDLLNSVVFAAALAIDRIKLQEDLILEKLEAQRLKELDEMRKEFINTMTHELKTPLSNIKMFTQLTEKNILDSQLKPKENLKIIEGESEKLQSMIENILDFAKIEKGMLLYELKKIEITEVIIKAISSAQYQFRIKQQTLENKVNSKKIYICADDIAVERAVLNLLTNASKYSAANSITIISSEVDKDFFTVSIKDNGRGIPEKEIEEIFEPFTRVHEDLTNKTKGTGLGLAIVKHIMDTHNGKIEVQSKPGEGSTFTLYFPLIKNEKVIGN